MADSPVRDSAQANLDFRWKALIRSRLEGLTDAEYLWEPAPGCLSVHPNPPDGYVLDPVVPGNVPFGHIAWRMTHLAFSMSNHPVAAVMFGHGWLRPELAAPAGTAAHALDRLDRAYDHWRDSVAQLSDVDLSRRLGPGAGQYTNSTALDLVLHIQAEVLQRGADLCLLRDLYVHTHRD